MAVADISAPEQGVLLVLCVMANDEAKCWPGINGAAGLTGKTKLSERTVQRAVQGLKEKGHISWVDIDGKGRIYTVAPRQADTPTPVTATPRQSGTPVTVAPTPATVTPKLPRTTITPKKASPPLGSRAPKRATAIPANFEPVMTGKTAECVDGWPPGRLSDELEHFADYHRANGTTSLDWQASWRTWVRNSKKWEPRNGKRSHHDRPAGAIESRRRARRDVGLDFGDRDAIG